jgi:hypothetical protein
VGLWLFADQKATGNQLCRIRRVVCARVDFYALRCRSTDLKELEIVVFRHELAILRRRTRRPVMT